MRLYGKFKKLPLSSVRPQGWLRRYLELQKEGLTGHLEEAGYPFDTVSWAIGDEASASGTVNPGWWAYEQTAYWLDGMERTGELLGDQELTARVDAVIEAVLRYADEDGYLGPRFLKATDGWCRWPHVVFFRAIMARYSVTNDNRLVEAVLKHYLNSPCDYSTCRDVMNVEIMLWAYEHSGDRRLLHLAEETYRLYNEHTFDDNTVASHLSRRKPYAHGVTYNEFAKLGAILYLHTGNVAYLRPSIKAYEKIDRYFMLVDGLHCSNEFMIDNHYMRCHETCDVSDYTWSLYYMLMATGDASYADKIERCIFNAGIGSVDERFRAHQYFSCPNQLVLDTHSNHNDFFMGDKWMSYRPNPGTECCAGNVNRFFPNYCAGMYAQAEDGVAVALYGASACTFNIADIPISIKQQTSYPFGDCVELEIVTPQDIAFSLYLRIPSWCGCPSLLINDDTHPVSITKGFAVITREFRNGDRIRLQLPSDVCVKREKSGGVYVEKGPLVYALGMYGDREIDQDDTRSSDFFPAYNIYPNRDWNYALVSGEGNLDLTAFECDADVDTEPWHIDRVPCRIRVSARKVNGWRLTLRKTVRYVDNLYCRPWRRIVKKGSFLFTPLLPSEKHMATYGYGAEEDITLVPMGCAKVRMTVLPQISDKNVEKTD